MSARIAIVDSGIAAGHPHVGEVAGGVAFFLRGGEVAADGDWRDRIGHGTAVAGVLREALPDAELLAVRIFDREMVAPVELLLAGLRWSVEARVDFVNLSLGTIRFEWRREFEEVCAEARRRGVTLVAPATFEGRPSLPGCLPGVVAVEAGPSVPRGEVHERRQGDATVLVASPFPRDVPGLPREANFAGVSFAVAAVVAAFANGTTIA